MEGETQSLHGKCVPASYTKIVIDYIQPATEPLFKTDFDDDVLQVGQYTAWPTDRLSHNM